MAFQRRFAAFLCALAAVSGLVAAIVVAAPASASREVGIGDQRVEMFSNRHFAALHMKIARLIVSYDAVLHHTVEARDIDNWIKAAEASGVKPLITFQHVRGCYIGQHGYIPRWRKCHLPTVREFRRAFLAFKHKYPKIREYSPWNEANHSSQPTYNNPRRAAEYYNVVRAACRGCTIVAADVLDQKYFTDWLREFRRWAHGHPSIWGIHNYEDTNNHTTFHTHQMLNAVHGQVWFTETGGIVRFGHRAFNPGRAAWATKFMFTLARISPRIKRIYVYSWSGVRSGDRFDAGLTDRHGQPRQAYWVVKAYMDRLRGRTR